MALGMPVAIEAPTHAQRLVVRDDGHLVDLAVAAFASDSAFHVDGMIEIDVIRRLVNPLPRYLDCRSSSSPGLRPAWDYLA